MPPIFHMVPDAPTPVAPFSHAAEVDGWVIVTGQMPTDPLDDGAALPEEVVAQTRRVMDNLILVLEGRDLRLADVVGVRAYLSKFKRDCATFSDAYASYFPSAKRPARTCIGVTGRARDVCVEVDMIAKRQSG